MLRQQALALAWAATSTTNQLLGIGHGSRSQFQKGDRSLEGRSPFFCSMEALWRKEVEQARRDIFQL
jgi:hypothetical protein